MAELENIVLVHLRELRADMNARFDAMEKRFETCVATIEKRLDVMHANGLKALSSFVGHRTILERTMPTMDTDLDRLKRRVDEEVAELRQRVDRPESPRP